MKTILVDAINSLVLKDRGAFNEMYELLKSYPNRKIVLTNANDNECKKFGLDKIPFELFTPKHTPEKTNPQYYELMLAKYGLKKDQVIYFEHNIEAVKSAQSAGIKTYYYDKNTKDLIKLKDFLDNNL